jgi:DNA-binding transcriptional LysR family regulator
VCHRRQQAGFASADRSAKVSNSMELRHLRYFQAVAEELSFSRAARRLRIAQPALSRAVQEMERELGTQLIERERRSPRLTPAGAVLLHETGLILERLDESLRRVKRTARAKKGSCGSVTSGRRRGCSWHAAEGISGSAFRV